MYGVTLNPAALRCCINPAANIVTGSCWKSNAKVSPAYLPVALAKAFESSCSTKVSTNLVLVISSKRPIVEFLSIYLVT